MKNVHAGIHGRGFWDLTLAVTALAGLSVAGAALTLAAGADALWARVALRILAAHGVLAAFCVAYARLIEPRWIAVTRRTIRFPTERPLRIAVIGDFHVNESKNDRFLARAAARCNALEPDLVLLVGDFVFDHRSDIAPLAELGNLRARCGVFAVVGNHDSSSDHLPGHRTGHRRELDRSDDLQRLLEPLGIRFLRNASTSIDHGGERVVVAGIDDVWMETCDLRAALKGVPNGAPTILLSHNPDIILDPASHKAHLIASGHTHGGQVRLPWLGPLCALPQRLSKKFDRGIFGVTPACTLAVTHGIGEMHVPLRLFARPEILLLETTSPLP